MRFATIPGKGERLQKRALITGITGQDGSYLAEFLLAKGYQVFGMVRRSSLERFDRIEAFRERISIVYGDLLDQSSLANILKECRPHEVYNLAAQSFVPTSWREPVLWSGLFVLPGTDRHVSGRCPRPSRYPRLARRACFGPWRWLSSFR